MKVYVLTLFPEVFGPVLESSILGRAREAGILEVVTVNNRDFAADRHCTVDDYPYGGGPGMVLKPEPVYRALAWIERDCDKKPYVVLMTPQGRKFTTQVARELAGRDPVVLVAGHYEGFDERIRSFAHDEISIGDFVLTGGEIAAMAVLDAASRFLPGVLGDETSAEADSFSDGLLEGPQYTRPPEFLGMEVPLVLRQGDRAAIWRWRRKESLRRTLERRKDLLREALLTYEDRRLLAEVLDEERVDGKDLW
jgi:tRNA (guanine37-N1)-methyltransferase